MKDCMIDLETMGVGSNPALLQISAVPFNINTCEYDADGAFNTHIDLNSCFDHGLTVSAGTIRFWMTNPQVTQEAREMVMSQTGEHTGGGTGLVPALVAFNKWYAERGMRFVHGNGAASDNVWLRSAFDACGIAPLFNFRNDMCFRTIKKMAERSGWRNNYTRVGVYHNGVDDAVSQILTLKSVLEHLGLLGRLS